VTGHHRGPKGKLRAGYYNGRHMLRWVFIIECGILHSLTQTPSLFDAPGTEAFTSKQVITKDKSHKKPLTYCKNNKTKAFYAIQPRNSSGLLTDPGAIQSRPVKQKQRIYICELLLPKKPRFFPTCIKLLPFCWFNFDTMVSAGWETTAQKTPAAQQKTLINLSNIVQWRWQHLTNLSIN